MRWRSFKFKRRQRALLREPVLGLFLVIVGFSSFPSDRGGMWLELTLFATACLVLGLIVLVAALTWNTGIARTRSRSPQEVADATFCSECGYNLKGNESGVCPECGSTVRNV